MATNKEPGIYMLHQYNLRRERVKRAEDLLRKYEHLNLKHVFIVDALCSRYDIEASKVLVRKILAEAIQEFEWLVGPPR